jgi:hypothetical protein
MRLLRAILAGALGAAAAFLVACGDSNGLLSPSDASGLNGKLNAVSAAVADHSCPRARTAAADLQGAVVSLPGAVDRRLLTNLRQGAATVAARAKRDCTRTQTQTTPTETQTTTTQTQTQTQTETTPTQTTTTQTQTQTVPTQTTTTPTQTNTTPTTRTTTSGGTGDGGAAPGLGGGGGAG